MRFFIAKYTEARSLQSGSLAISLKRLGVHQRKSAAASLTLTRSVTYVAEETISHAHPRSLALDESHHIGCAAAAAGARKRRNAELQTSLRRVT